MVESGYMKSALRVVGVILLIGALILALFFTGLKLWGNWHDEWSGYNASQYVSDEACNVAILPVFGDILAYRGADKDGTTVPEDLPPSVNPDDVENFFQSAEANSNIRGVLAEIHSFGGSGSGGEIIANRFKNSQLPVVAAVRGVAVSAAYQIATGADYIVAFPSSDIGSIGVTMSYLDKTEQNSNDGFNFVSLSSAKFKDYGNPDKPLTAEERVLFERDLKIGHDDFVKYVSESRNIPFEEVAKIADGSSMAGSLALEHKLIDALGDKETAREWFAEELGIPVEEVIFCQ